MLYRFGYPSDLENRWSWSLWASHLWGSLEAEQTLQTHFSPEEEESRVFFDLPFDTDPAEGGPRQRANLHLRVTWELYIGLECNNRASKAVRCGLIR